MRFIGIREFRGNAAKVMENLKTDKEIVITSNGKPVAILTPTDDQRLEESLAAIRTARAVQAVASLQRRSRELGTDEITPQAIEDEIRAARRARKR